MHNFNDPALVFEHQLRDVIRQTQERVESETQASYCNVTFEKPGSDDGRWRINSWGNGTADVTTTGAVLGVVTDEHIRRVNREKSLKTLPSLLAAPSFAIPLIEPEQD